jgi:hypothetical protein
MANCLRQIGKRVALLTSKPKYIDRNWQDAINLSNDDPNITTVDLINKGFALLALDKDGLSWKARQCFNQAAEMDKSNMYNTEIQCGLERTKENNTCNCFFGAGFNEFL